MTNYETSGKTVTVASGRKHADGQRMMANPDRMSAAMVDANHPDCRGMTLQQEEEALAREYEISRTRWARSADDREERTRQVVTDELTGIPPETTGGDYLGQLDADTQAAIRQEAERLTTLTDRGPMVGAIAQQIAKKIVGGKGLSAAVLDTVDWVKAAPGAIVPPHAIPKADREELHTEGEVTELWESDSPKIQDVGLISGPKDKVKFTSWVKSGMPTVEEGDRIRIWNAAKNWYKGRVSIALTGDSRIEFVEKAPRDDGDDGDDGDDSDQADAADSEGVAPVARSHAGLFPSELQAGMFDEDAPDFEAPEADYDGSESWEWPAECQDGASLDSLPHWRTGEQTRVGHCKRDDCDVYVGRGPDGQAMDTAPVGSRGWLGNPYSVEEHGRETAIQKFAADFHDRIERDEEFRRHVLALEGKVLGCWCQELDESGPACHAEVIANFINHHGGQESTPATATPPADD